MSRWVRTVIAAVGLALAVAPAAAQPQDAIGKPLPDPSLRDGTVVVRLIAGDRSKPVPETEVTLTQSPADGSDLAPVEQRARTDADGRATFVGVPPNVRVRASASGTGGGVTSSPFPMPMTGGIRLMVSTVSAPGATGAMPAAGGGPPMSPRAMSGQPRPEPADDGDVLTVRLSYDDFADPTPPKDHPVILVDYRWDQIVSAKVVKTDAGGRAVFRGLNRGGSHSYFAMTLLPRGDGFDRLISRPIVMPGDTGVRLILSGDKRAVATPVDDLGVLDPQPAVGVPGGQVDVTLGGAAEPGKPIELVDAFSGEVLARTTSGPPTPDSDSLKPIWGAGADDPALAVGNLTLTLARAGAPAKAGRVDVRRVALPTGPAQGTAALWTATGGGEVALTGLPVGEPLEVRVTVEGVALPTKILRLPAAGGRRESVDATWSYRGQASASFSGITVGGLERGFLVRAVDRQTYVSAPFQLTATRGAAVTLIVVPRVMLTFSLSSWVDDVYFGVRGTFSIRNTSWAPYVAGTNDRPEEIVIALPKGFVGATVRQDFTETIGVDPTRGFIIRRPLPPGGLDFVGAFSIEFDGGELKWDMPLPLGALESELEIKRDWNSMSVELPPAAAGVSVREAKAAEQRFFVLQPITILPGRSMVFTVRGLPRPAAWSRYAKAATGLLVLAILGLGIGLAMYQRPATAAGNSRVRYDQVLDELAALEEEGVKGPRREQLLAELERLDRKAGPG